jgi:hypothetical protein
MDTLNGVRNIFSTLYDGSQENIQTVQTFLYFYT